MNAARLEDLHLWKMEKEYVSRKGIKRHEYWMAPWRRSSKFITRIWDYAKMLDIDAALGKAMRLRRWI
jgi:hypothetical protein